MHLFAYGTLMDSDIMTQVCGASYQSSKATLSGYVRKLVHGEIYPAIVREAGGCVDGMIYYNVSSQAFDRLDKFEGELYDRVKVIVICEDGLRVAAFSYVIRANCANRLSTDDWDYENFLHKDKPLFQR